MDALSVMRQLGGGDVLPETAEKLVAVAQQVLASGEGGSVTVRYAVKPLKQAGELTVVIETSISMSLPKASLSGAVLFVHGGEFHKSDPRQEPLPEFRVVEQTDGTVQAIHPGTGEIREAGL